MNTNVEYFSPSTLCCVTYEKKMKKTAVRATQGEVAIRYLNSRKFRIQTSDNMER